MIGKKRQGLSPNAPVIFEDDRAIEIAKLLLKHGADFNRKITGHYDRPLQWALNRDSWKLAEFYIHNGADPNYRHPHADRTLLMEFPQIECAKLLVRNGLDLAHKNTDGQTTLEFIQSRLVKLEKDRQNHSDKKIQNLKEIIQILQ